MNPACCRRMLQVLCLGELFNHNSLCFALRNREGEWQREIDGETGKEETEVCLHLCDNVWPSRPVSSLSVWPRRRAAKEDRGGSTTLSIYHRPWPGRLWNFRDSFNGVVEPQSGAETLHMAIKKNKYKDYVLPCLLREVRAVRKRSCGISVFLLLLSQRGNFCRPLWDGVG